VEWNRGPAESPAFGPRRARRARTDNPPKKTLKTRQRATAGPFLAALRVFSGLFRDKIPLGEENEEKKGKGIL
jgi:hypothetical protein